LNLKEPFKSTTVADKILLSVLLLLSFSGIIFVKEVLSKGKTVLIEVDNRPVYVLPVDKDRSVSVQGPMGKTVVEIMNHRVRIAESPCHNKLCIKQGWIESGAIICLPNRVVVTIGNHEDESDKTVDAITG
jgi:hypothetical protein